MALEYGVTAKLPPAWKELIEKRIEEDDELKSTNAYLKKLVAKDLGLSDIPELACEVTNAIFEDFHAASKILDLLPDELLAAIIQFHLERDETLLSRERFDHVYKYPHDYVPLKKAT